MIDIEIFRVFGSVFIKDSASKKLEDVDKKGKKTKISLDKIGEATGKIGKNMSMWVTGPLVGAGAGLLALATKAGNTADRLIDLSDITGMSTDAIQEYQHVAKLAGVSTEAVTQAAEGLIRRLPGLQEEGSKSAEIIKELGVSVEGTADEIMDNMLVALANIEDPLERNSQGAQLFGGAWKDLAPILGMGADGIAEAREEAQKLGVVMGNDALNDANNFRIEMDRLKAVFTGLFLEIGTKVAPIMQDIFIPLIETHLIPLIGKLTNEITFLANWFARLSTEQQKTILIIVGIVAALGPFLIIVSKVIAIVKTAIVTFKALGVVIAGISAPVLITIGVIVALIAIGVLLYKNWDEVSAFLVKSWEWIKQVATNVFIFLANFFKNQLDTIKGYFNVFISLLTGDWDRMWDGMKSVAKGAANMIIGIFNGVISGAEGMINAVSKAINSLPTFEIPDWVPGVGGGSFGLPKIPTLNIPRIPGLADGGNVIGSGATLVGERGPEILDLPRGSRVTPLDKQGINIYITGNSILGDRDADRFGDMLVNRLEALGVT